MRNLTYHVATTLDGFIAHLDGSITGFNAPAPKVDDYKIALETYDTVVMGRKTYEYGYDFGIKPGDPPYPRMRHYIFSKSIALESNDRITIVRGDPLPVIDALKAEPGSEIYLCGGGAFAGFLARHGRIDRIILKVSSHTYGVGIPLFGGEPLQAQFALEDVKAYETGVVQMRYRKATPS